MTEGAEMLCMEVRKVKQARNVSIIISTQTEARTATFIYWESSPAENLDSQSIAYQNQFKQLG